MHTFKGRRAFTLIELLVVILIIAIAMGLLLAGVRAVFKNAQGVADLQAARAMGTGISQFENDNGFVVPLVADGDPLMLGNPPALPALLDKAEADSAIDAFGGNYENMPLMESSFGAMLASVAVYSDSRDVDFLRGGRLLNGSGGIAEEAVVFELTRDGVTSDRRYSKFGLPIYLSGVLDRSVDGVDGPGLTSPARDGTFAGVTGQGARTPIDAYIDSAADFLELSTGYSKAIEAQEHHGSDDVVAGRQFGTAYVDRYGNAFRYYRWEPGRNARNFDDISGGRLGESSNAIDTNIPFVISDMIAYGQQAGELALPAGATAREQVDATGGNPQLRSARWAIVGAGPDGFFGTEPMSVLDRSGSAQTAEEIALIRARAQEDNVVIIEP